MFCNFCGKKIAPEDRVCPYCGQAQESRSGGNGFWDILTNQSPVDDADPEPMRTVREPVRPMREPAPPMPAPPAPTDRRRRKTGRGILILSIITVVLLLGSIALDVVLFLNIDKKFEAISEALTGVNESTEALVPETTPSAPSETKAPTEPASAPTTAPTGEPSTAEGTSDPSATLGATGNDPAEEVSIIIEQPVDIKEGVVAGTEDAMFHIKYDAGEGRMVVWYYGGDPGWKPIDDSKDEFKNIFQVTNTADGYSCLKIIGADPGVYGQYRCEILQEDAVIATSETVKFIFKQE